MAPRRAEPVGARTPASDPIDHCGSVERCSSRLTRHRAPAIRHGRARRLAPSGLIAHHRHRLPVRTTRTTRPESCACTTWALPAPLRPPTRRGSQGPLGPKWCSGALSGVTAGQVVQRRNGGSSGALSGATAGLSGAAAQRRPISAARCTKPRKAPTGPFSFSRAFSRPAVRSPAATSVGREIVCRIANARNHYGVTSVCPRC